MKNLFRLILISLALSLFFATTTHAASRYWIGSGGDWSDGANWSTTDGGGSCSCTPGIDDDAIFTSNGANAVIDGDIQVDIIRLDSTYTGTVSVDQTLVSDITLQIDETLEIQDGTMNLSDTGSFDTILSITGDIIQYSGAFTAGGGAVTIGDDILLNTLSGKPNDGTITFNNSSAVTVTATISLGRSGSTGGLTSTPNTLTIREYFNNSASGSSTFTHNNGTITFDRASGNQSTSLNGDDLNNVNINLSNTGSISVNGTINVLGTLNLQNGLISGSGRFSAQGNITNSLGFDGGTGEIRLDHTSATTVTITAGADTLLPDFVVNSSNSTVQISGSPLRFDNNLHVFNGTFNPGTTNITIDNEFVQEGGSYNAADTATGDFSSIDLIIKGGSFDSGTGTYTVTDDLLVSTLAPKSATADFSNATLLDVTDALTVGTSSSTGGFTFPTATNIGGHYSQSSGGSTSVTHSSGTVTFDGSQTANITINADNLYNVIVNKDLDSLELNLGSTMKLDGDITITQGILDAGTRDIQLAGDWNMGANGDFTEGTRTVTLTGTNQAINGSNTFYNLTKNVTSAATLTLEAGETQTISNTLNLQGQSGELLSIRSSSSGVQTSIDPQATRTFNYLDVKDNNNTNATSINITGINSVDADNNTNWDFVDTVTFNSVSLTLNNDADTNSKANVGDTIRIELDVSNTDGACNVAAGTTATVDLSNYGGSASQALTCTTPNGGVNDILRYDLVITDAGGSGIDLAASNASSQVTVTATDLNEPNSTSNSNSLTAAVDTTSPTLTATKLTADESACTGTSGICKVGDIITFKWDNSASGDNNSDITATSQVSFNLSNFGGGTTVTPDSVAANIFTADFTVISSDDDGSFNFSATVTDDAGNSSGPTTSTDTATVDNDIPVAISNLTASSPTTTGVNINWTAVGSDFTGYEIYYRTTAGVDDTNGTAWTSTDAPDLSTIGTTSTQVTGLDSDTTYYFTVYSLDSSNNRSSIAPEITAITEAVSSGGGGVLLPIGSLSSLTPSTPVEETEPETDSTSTSTPSSTPSSTPTEDGSSSAKILGSSTSLLNTEAGTTGFIDTVNHWGEDLIEELRVVGVVNGRQPLIYEPDQSINFAELLKMSFKTFAVPNFKNSDSQHWSEEYLTTAESMDLLNVLPHNTVSYTDYSQNISRIDGLALILEIADLQITNTQDLIFADTNTSAWYSDHLSYSIENFIVIGFEDQFFRPQQNLTRSEAAKMIYQTATLLAPTRHTALTDLP